MRGAGEILDWADVVHGTHAPASPSANASERLRTLSDGAGRQREIPLLQTLPAPVDASRQAVAMCHSEADAIAVSKLHRLRGRSWSWIAKQLGYGRSYVSEIKTGAKSMPEDRVADFCRLCGTNLLRQYRDLQRALTTAEHGESALQRAERIARELLRHAV